MGNTRSPEEIRERIADLLGYCLIDGELHDPNDYKDSLGGARWKCPDCGATALLTDYGRASELRWVLGGSEMESHKKSDTVSSMSGEDGEADGEFSEDEKKNAQDQTDLLENVKEVQESLKEEGSTLEEGIESISGSNSTEEDSNSNTEEESDSNDTEEEANSNDTDDTEEEDA